MRLRLLAVALVFITTPVLAHHPTKNQYTLQVKNHQFSPTTLEVPANTSFKLIIGNNADQPVHFTSQTAQLNKDIAADGAAVINVPPLPAGQYPFTISNQSNQGVLVAIAHEK